MLASGPVSAQAVRNSPAEEPSTLLQALIAKGLRGSSAASRIGHFVQVPLSKCGPHRVPLLRRIFSRGTPDRIGRQRLLASAEVTAGEPGPAEHPRCVTNTDP